MSDSPEQNNNGGWSKPVQVLWVKPPDALSEEQLAALRENPPDTLPEPEINTHPAMAGAWYRPNGEGDSQALETPSIDSTETPAQPASFDPFGHLSPDQLGQFDSSRSNLLPGIDTFDAARSGQLAGIGDEEPAAFDDSKSGALAGLVEEPPVAFDDSKSGALPGIGTAIEEPDLGLEPEPTIVFDDSKSGALPGIGEEGVIAESPIEQPAADVVAAEPVLVVAPQFAEVEQKVDALRQQYQNGTLSRPELQEELRKLLIIDDAGRWWMVGLESNEWYRYDGANWVKDVPPKVPATGQAAIPPTATGVQAVAGAALSEAISGDSAAGYQDTPLPNRVPLEDLGATQVGQSAIHFGDRGFDAPTQAGFQTDDALPPDATLPSGTLEPTQENMGAYELDPALGEVGSPAPKPAGPRMVNGQPDYSAAFNGNFDRANLTKWALRASIFGGLAAMLLIFLAVIAVLGYYFSIVGQYSNEIDNLGSRAAAFETSIIYDGEGNVLAEFNDPRGGARQSVPLEEMSPWLIHATIATEDETYYENPGFSIFGIARAVFQNARTGGAGGGASTITQQLARALVFDPEFASQRTGNRKIHEIIVASEIARRYDKNEILAFYLNEIYYGNRAYGAEAASQVYFNKRAADLNVAEAALLAGLPQTPALYDPVVNRETARLRMEDVLRLMTEANGNGCIQMQHAPYNTEPFCVTEQMLTETYVVEVALVETKTFEPPRYEVKYPHFVNYVFQQLEKDYGSQRIYSSGFRVYTTIVPSIQDTAQQAVLDEIPITPGANNGAVVAMRPTDGAVLAMVGSANFDDESIDGQVNVAFTPQQPGSTIKPFVYLTAFEGIGEGDYWYPGTIVWDVLSCWAGVPQYCPKNWDSRTSGAVSVRFALAQSLNIPAVKALAYITPERLQATLDRVNVETPLQTVPTVGLPAALGAAEVYMLDLVRGYGAFANGGVQVSPYAITRIENVAGEEIYRVSETVAGNPVMRPEYAYLITDILSDPAVKPGANLSIPGWRAAAKTGTTNDNRDAWTIGYTPNLVVAVWVGRTDNQPMGSNVYGSNTAAPIWNKVMQAGLAGLPAQDFVRPSTIVDVQICPYTGALYTPENCPNAAPTVEIAFNTQQPPQEGFIKAIQVDSFTGLLPNPQCPNTVTTRSFANLTDQTAIEWLNTTGQSFATQYGITLPVAGLPTEAASGPCARIALTSPQANEHLAGLVEMRGTVDVPNLQSYGFRLAEVANPDLFSQILAQYHTPQTNNNGLLGTVEFTGIPNGNYILRLEVIGQSNATGTVDVPIVINNSSGQAQATPITPATPDPNLILPTSTPAPTLTPSTGEQVEVPAAGSGGGSEFEAVPPPAGESGGEIRPPDTTPVVP